MTSPASGWYPDPSGQPGERWWNGVSWANDTRPAPAAAPAEAPQAWDGFGNPAPPRQTPATPVPGNAPPAYGTTPEYGTRPSYGSPPPFATQQYGGAPGGAKPSWVARNGFSIGTVGVAVGYLLILVFAHFAILGILPLFLGFRAVSRKEPLAWVAVLVGVAALIFGIYEYTR